MSVNLSRHFNILSSFKKQGSGFQTTKIKLPHQGLQIVTDHSAGIVCRKNFRKKIRLEGGCFVLPKEAINYLSPDNINCNTFWKKSVELFPTLSIGGNAPSNLEPEEINRRNIESFASLGPVKWLFENLTTESTFLEIGPGYGGIYYLTEDVNKNNNANAKYFSIDVNPLFWHDNMYVTDGKTIPNDIPDNLDLVYSMNVFQHLSKLQRESYYKQVYEKLVPGGVFIVGLFCITQSNREKPFWGHRDEEGKYYTSFLGQYTEVEVWEDWANTLAGFGYKCRRTSESGNYVALELVKPL